MSKRGKVNRLEKGFDGRAYAESRKLPHIGVSAEDIQRAADAMGLAISRGIVRIMARSWDEMFLPMERYLSSLEDQNIEEAYSEDMPGMTIDEFQAWSDEAIREADRDA